MGLISEFKTFAMKGNVIDLSIGIVIGSAFNKIINSMIEDVLTPLILNPALKAAHLTNIQDLTIMGSVKYGMFLSALINFALVAFALFIFIKAINIAKKKEEAAHPMPTQEQLLTDIRDLLKNKN